MRSRRAGISLTEVLIAMFIMAVGMIALMTLFPLGAMRIGQSLKDDRCTQLALQMDGQMRAIWRNEVVAQLAAGQEPTEAFYHAMDDPNLVANISGSPAVYTAARIPEASGVDLLRFLPKSLQLFNSNNAPLRPTATGPVSSTTLLTDTYLSVPATTDPNVRAARGATLSQSYPVLIDPYGCVNSANQSSLNYFWLGGTSSGPSPSGAYVQIPRRNVKALLPALSPLGAATAFSKLTDDYTFGMNGQAGDATNPVARQGRYSAAVLLQRPVAQSPTDTQSRQRARMQILVFDGRSPSPVESDEARADVVYVAPGDPNNTPVVSTSRQVRLRVPTRPEDSAPTLRRGGWLLDGTTYKANGVFHANFHRIVAVGVAPVASPAGTTTYDIDLETDLVGLPTSVPPLSYHFYFMAGLSEVFDRADLNPDFDQ